MPIIQHEGRDYYLKTLRFNCLECWTLCETSVVGNPRSQANCRCGQVNIDGGISSGSTLNGDPRRMEDLSVYRTIDVPHLRLPQEIVTARHQRVRDQCHK